MKKTILRMALYSGVAVLLAVALLHQHNDDVQKADPLSTVVHSYDGQSWVLSRYRGKPIIVNFWATWCPPCLRELPEFVNFSENHANDTVVVGFAVNSPKQDVANMVRRFNIRYPIAKVDLHTLENWGFHSLPATYVLDGDGKVLWTKQGATTAKELEKVLAR